MIGEKTIIPADVIQESDIAPIMRRANELKEENEKVVGERALCEVQELIAKNKRLVEEHNRQNGTIQALNIALDVITDRYSNLRKRLCITGKGGE